MTDLQLTFPGTESPGLPRPRDGRPKERPEAVRPPELSPQERIDRVRDAIAKISQGRRCGLRTMVCPNCEDGIVYFGVRRCGSISATCSCPGGILIDDETLDEAMRRADASATDNASAAKWLQKSQPPEQ